MDKRYLQGYESIQEPEGIQGTLYKIEVKDESIKYLFVDTIEYGRIQYWYFGADKKLIDGGEIEDSPMEPDQILAIVCDCMDIPEDAVLLVVDSDLCIGDLEPEFTGM